MLQKNDMMLNRVYFLIILCFYYTNASINRITIVFYLFFFTFFLFYTAFCLYFETFLFIYAGPFKTLRSRLGTLLSPNRVTDN